MRPLAFALVALALTPGLASAQPQCTSVSISASPTRTEAPSGFFSRDGGVGLAYVTGSAPDCTWTAAADMPWVTFPDGTTGVGAAWLRYAVAAWPPSPSIRSANISITSATRTVNFNILQDGRAKGDGVGWMQSPAGWNASPSTGTVAQPFRISGFAIDDFATTGTGISSVDIVYVDDTGFHSLGTATYGLSHPHMGQTRGTQFTDSGYELLVSGIPPGGPGFDSSFSIQAFAHSSVDGSLIASGATRVSIVDPSLTVAPASLQFGAASTSGAAPAVTPAQSLTVQGFGWTTPWTASTTQPWIRLSAPSGTGPGPFDVSIDPAQVPASGVLLGSIHIDAGGVPGAPIDIPVRVDAYFASSTAPPFGAFDFTPSPTANAVPLTGWALDDVGVTGVSIYRSASQFESGQSLVFIGDATFVDGARPDVAAAFPNTPQKTRAGWGYMLLSNVLPGGGNETLTFYAFARDAEGKQTLIGTRAVTLANATGDQPFGALDAPAPGETVSGVFTFAGWAVTPQPRSVTRVSIHLDGQFIGTTQYGLARPDVAALFGGPGGPLDANTPGFQFTLDTRGLANGLHTIAVLAFDNSNAVAGLGSRFFTVKNP